MQQDLQLVKAGAAGSLKGILMFLLLLAWSPGHRSVKLDLSENFLAPGSLGDDMLTRLQQLKVLCLNSCGLTQWPLSCMAAEPCQPCTRFRFAANPLRTAALPALGVACLPQPAHPGPYQVGVTPYRRSKGHKWLYTQAPCSLAWHP